MHVMLDLETWGTKPGSAIRSIAAVTFNFEGALVSAAYFYRNITDASCIDAGLKRDERTVAWWAKQDVSAQDALLVDQQPLKEVMKDFSIWWRNRALGGYVWAQGAGFDPVLWEAACGAVDYVVPWDFRDVRDTRTLYDLAKLDAKKIKFEGERHNALDDCRYQIKCCRAAYQILKGDPANFTTKV